MSPIKFLVPNIKIIRGDITTVEVDAIVNAANSSLSYGAGVCGAIHKAAGPKLSQACKMLGGCKTGQAKITLGFNLPARFIIHTVGPVWRGGGAHEPELLENCYRNSMSVAKDNNIKSIAFPAISCGIFGYPVQQATEIAVRTIKDILEQEPGFEQVLFVCFEDETFKVYNSLMQKSS